jgi:hypothetical protein
MKQAIPNLVINHANNVTTLIPSSSSSSSSCSPAAANLCFFLSPISAARYAAQLHFLHNKILIYQLSNTQYNAFSTQSACVHSEISYASILAADETLEAFSISNTQLLTLAIYNSQKKYHLIRNFTIKLIGAGDEKFKSSSSDLILGSSLSAADYSEIFHHKPQTHYNANYYKDYSFRCDYLHSTVLSTPAPIHCIQLRVIGSLHLPEQLLLTSDAIIALHYNAAEKTYQQYWDYDIKQFNKNNSTSLAGKLACSHNGNMISAISVLLSPPC